MTSTAYETPLTHNLKGDSPYLEPSCFYLLAYGFSDKLYINYIAHFIF